MDPKTRSGLDPRPLTPAAAVGLAVLYTLLLVVPFYISPTTRPSPTLSRDHSSVIRTRIRLVTLTCLLCAPISIGVLRTRAGLPWPEVWRFLGWWPVRKKDVGQALLLTAVLFAGPLYERAVANGGAARWLTGTPLKKTLGSWIGIRNYVMGPLSEEFLFRSLLTPLYLISALPPSLLASSTSASAPSSLSADDAKTITRTILLSPLPFALAHLHHFHASRLTHPHAPLLALVLGSLLQFTYTAMFGWFAAFVFVRTASLAAVVLVHSLANWMGLPRVWGAVGTCVDSISSRSGRPNRSSVALVRLHTVLYYTLLLGGAVGFGKLLWRLTESENGLVRGY